VDEKLDRWLSLSIDPFKPGRAQLSANGVIPGWSEGPDPESRDSGFALARAPE
jgi:hypothetical protein